MEPAICMFFLSYDVVVLFRKTQTTKNCLHDPGNTYHNILV
jgi:hypothetical protein